MNLVFETVTGVDVVSVIDELAVLRGKVFRDWPYLYAANPDYERRYLSGYAQDGAIVVIARDGPRIVGAATGMPLLQHEDNLSTALKECFSNLGDIFYCAESVLLSVYRGQGAGHRFFDHREDHARKLGLTHSVFCAVVRHERHPKCPPGYRDLAPFWAKRGYRQLNAHARMSWPDVGDDFETEKSLKFWHREL